MEQRDLETALLKHYGHTFGPNDKQMIPVGNGHQPKWRNTLAWAKVMVRSQWELEDGSLTPLFLQRTRQEKGQKKTYIVLIDDNITSPEWIEWVAGRKRPKRQFFKVCRSCRRRNAIGAGKCWRCEAPFPRKSAPVHRLPK